MGAVIDCLAGADGGTEFYAQGGWFWLFVRGQGSDLFGMTLRIYGIELYGSLDWFDLI